MKRIKKIAIYGLSVWAAVYLLIWAISPLVMRYFLNNALLEQQLVLSDDSRMRFNPFRTRLTVDDFQLIPVASDKYPATKKYNQENPAFKLGHLSLEFHLHRLLFKQLYVRELTLDDVYVDVVRQRQWLMAAGLVLPSDGEKKATELAGNKKQGDESRAEISGEKHFLEDFTLVLPDMTFSRLGLVVDDEGREHHFFTDKIVLNNTRLLWHSQQLVLRAVTRIDDAPLMIHIAADVQDRVGNLSLALTLDDYPLQKANAYLDEQAITIHNGLLSVDWGVDVAFSTSKISTKVSTFKLFVDDLDIEKGNKKLVLDGLQLSIPDSAGPLVSAMDNVNSDDFLMTFSGMLALSTHSINVSLADGSRLLSLQDAKVDSFRVKYADDINFSIDEVSLDRLVVSESAEKSKLKSFLDTADVIDNEKALQQTEQDNLKLDSGRDSAGESDHAMLQLKKIRLLAISGSSRHLVIDKLNLYRLSSHVWINKDKSIATWVNWDENTDVKTEGVTAKESVKPVVGVDRPSGERSPEFIFSLNEFSLEQGAKIDFTDRSVNPKYKRLIYIDTLMAGPVDMSKPTEKTQFNLVGRSNAYATFHLSGDVTPLSEKLNVNLNGKLREISMYDSSGYFKDALGFEMQSGELDGDIDVAVVEDKISGKLKLKMRGVNMSAANDYEKGTLKDKTSMPLNVALGMLKDKRGNIDLPVPLTGDIADPGFGLDGFLALVTKKAVMSAAQSYLVNTFVPYANVVSVVKASGEYMLKLRFEDLLFAPGVSDINESQKVYMQQFVALMKDKQKAHVKACGLAIPQDIGLDRIADFKQLSDPQITQLRGIAAGRTEAFKRYVVNAGIASSRILMCTPEIDIKQDALPRIKISI